MALTAGNQPYCSQLYSTLILSFLCPSLSHWKTYGLDFIFQSWWKVTRVNFPFLLLKRNVSHLCQCQKKNPKRIELIHRKTEWLNGCQTLLFLMLFHLTNPSKHITNPFSAPLYAHTGINKSFLVRDLQPTDEMFNQKANYISEYM